MSDSERVSAPSPFSMTPEDAARLLVWPADGALMLRIVVWLQRARERVS